MSVSYRKLVAIREKKKFIIEEDLSEVGWYLKVFENDKCINDYLQDTLEDVIEFAETEYQVPSTEWKDQ